MPDGNHKNKPSRGLLILMVLMVFSLLGACNSQGGEVIRDTAKEVEPTEPAENSGAKTQEQEQKATPQVELTAQPPVEERFASFKPVGNVEQKLIRSEIMFVQELAEVLGVDKAKKISNELSETIDTLEIDGARSTQIIHREDSAGNVWFNIIVGSSSESADHFDRLWLYAEKMEQGSKYVRVGQGGEGQLIPIEFSYVVNGKRMGADLQEGLVPDGVMLGLGYGDEESFQVVNKIVYFDKTSGEVVYTDPWAGDQYSLNNERVLAFLAKLIPGEIALYPELEIEEVREAFGEGVVPRKVDGTWIAVNKEGEAVWSWDVEKKSWVKKRDVFDKEKFVNNLSEPSEYVLNIDGVEIEPGEIFMERLSDFEWQTFGVNGVVASYPYAREWNTQDGESYLLWQVDLAFPERDEDGGWQTLPFLVWVDYLGDDSRVINNFFYDISKYAFFGYGDMSTKQNRIIPFKADVHEVVDMNVYEELRNQVLGLYEPEINIAANVELQHDPSSYNGDPGIALKRALNFSGSVIAEMNSPLDSCIKTPEDDQKYLDIVECKKISEGKLFVGRVIEAVFVDKE